MSGGAQGRWGFLAAASLARGAIGFQFQALPALAPALGAGLGLGLADIGLLTGIYMLPGAAVALLAGALLQRISVRAAFHAGLAAMLACGLLAAAAGGFAGLAAARALGGFGAVIVTVAGLKGLYDRFEARELPLANGLSGGAQPFGMGCALLVFSALGAAADWRAGFLATAGVAAAGLGVTAALVRRAPRPGTTPGAPAAAPAGLSAWRMPRDEWTRLLLAGWTVTLFVGCFYGFLSLFPSFLHATGWAPRDAGLVLGGLGWAPIVMAPLGGWIAARTGRPGLLTAVCATIWGLSAVTASRIGATPLLIGLMLVLGPMPVGCVMSMGARAVSAERRGVASGVFMAFLFLGTSAMPAAAAWVGEAMAGAPGEGEAAAVLFCGLAFLSLLLPLALFERAARGVA